MKTTSEKRTTMHRWCACHLARHRSKERYRSHDQSTPPPDWIESRGRGFELIPCCFLFSRRLAAPSPDGIGSISINPSDSEPNLTPAYLYLYYVLIRLQCNRYRLLPLPYQFWCQNLFDPYRRKCYNSGINFMQRDSENITKAIANTDPGIDSDTNLIFPKEKPLPASGY